MKFKDVAPTLFHREKGGLQKERSFERMQEREQLRKEMRGEGEHRPEAH